jgi:hypothetical protein
VRRFLIVVLVGSSVALLAASSARTDVDPMIGYWNYGGGVVQVTGSGSSLTGTVVKATTFSSCPHPVGEAMWKLTRSASGYTGTHSWFAASDCTVGSLGYGASTWLISESGGNLLLHFCTTSPKDKTDTRCNDLTRAKPVAPAPTVWPALADAKVALASVSNGCGGGKASEEGQFGDTSSYRNSNNPFGKRYLVSFRLACNLHDAGYSGAKVDDPINGGEVDYYGWSQKRVDDKFLADMRKLCDEQLKNSGATVALADCKAHGGKTSWGAKTRYDFVREHGHHFYSSRPNLPSSWTGNSGALTLQITQTVRAVQAKWQNGGVSGEFRGTLISRDQDSIVTGFARTTENALTEQTAMTITVDPNSPNQIAVNGPGLPGTMKR